MDFLTTKEAAELKGISRKGAQMIILRNIKKYPDLARKAGRDWIINKEMFERLFVIEQEKD